MPVVIFLIESFVPSLDCAWPRLSTKFSHADVGRRENFAKPMNTLKSQIVRLIESTGDSNQICLTISPTSGWDVVFTSSQVCGDEILIISKEGLNEWARGFEWTDEQFDLAEQYIRDNIGDWLRYSEITQAQLNSHL